MSKALAVVLAALLAAGGLYTWARLHRYEISYGGNQRYYLAIKLDRWTGRAWKLNTGPGWTEITHGGAKAEAESAEPKSE